MHNNVIDGALNLDLVRFVGEIILAVRVWWVLMKDRSPVHENASHILRLRPDGIAPYIVGVPVLA